MAFYLVLTYESNRTPNLFSIINLLLIEIMIVVGLMIFIIIL
jgi:hypothetical protein